MGAVKIYVYVPAFSSWRSGSDSQLLIPRQAIRSKHQSSSAPSYADAGGNR